MMIGLMKNYLQNVKGEGYYDWRAGFPCTYRMTEKLKEGIAESIAELFCIGIMIVVIIAHGVIV